VDIRDFEYLRNFFLAKADYKARIWDFTHKVKSDVLIGNQDFRGDDPSWWITIIDPYRGVRPLLCNRELFLYGQISTGMYPMIWLDSNVVNALHTYVTRFDEMDPSRRRAMYEFISFVAFRNFDPSPLFYYWEKSAKSNIDDYEPYATERARAIFALQTMNKEEFLKTGRVVSNPAEHGEYIESRGVKSIDELMSVYAERYDVFKTGIVSAVDFGYASLLMIALTECQTTWSIREKFRKIQDFMADTLGIVLANELFVALLCFTHQDRYHRFIPRIQRGMNFTEFCRKLRASAWDLVLLRLPWLNLGLTILESRVINFSGCLSYICTTEHALRDIMSFQTLHIVFQLEDGKQWTRPLISYDLSTIQEIIGRDTMNEIILDDRHWTRKMMLSIAERKVLSPEKIALVVDALERGVSTYCKPGT
jgi:hypothetical protein